MGKFAGRDVVLAIDTVPIAQATAIGVAGTTRELIDASAHGDDFKDYVLGQMDGDELPLTLAYDPAEVSHDALFDAHIDALPHDFNLTHADASVDLDFPALVTHVARGGERDGLLILEATLKIVNPGITGS